MYPLQLSCKNRKCKDHQPILVSNENNRIKMDINVLSKPKRKEVAIASRKSKMLGKTNVIATEKAFDNIISNEGKLS